jgi:hypothetical protein
MKTFLILALALALFIVGVEARTSPSLELRDGANISMVDALGDRRAIGPANNIVVGPASDYEAKFYWYETDGTNDQVEINLALNKANATGKSVELMPGTYTTSAEITWPRTGDRSGIEMFGHGQNTRIQSSGSYSIINMSGGTSWYKGSNGEIFGANIHDLYIRGNSSSEGCGIFLHYVYESRFTNIDIHNVYRGIYDPDTSYNVYFCTFANINCDGKGGCGNIGYAALDMSSGACVFTNCAAVGGILKYGIRFGPSAQRNVVIAGEFAAGTNTASDYGSGKAAVLDEGMDTIFQDCYCEYYAPVYFNGSRYSKFERGLAGCGILVRNDSIGVTLDRGYWANTIKVYSPSAIINPKILYRGVGDEWGKKNGANWYFLPSASGVVANSTATGGYAARMINQNEALSWYVFAVPFSLPSGKYNIYYHAISSAGTTNDVSCGVYDYTDSRYLITYTAATVINSAWGEYGPYTMTINDDELNGALGDDIRIHVKKSTAATNTILVDYIKIEYMGPAPAAG